MLKYYFYIYNNAFFSIPSFCMKHLSFFLSIWLFINEKKGTREIYIFSIEKDLWIILFFYSELNRIEKNKQYRARVCPNTLRTMMTIFTNRINERLQCIKLVLWFSITNTGVLGWWTPKRTFHLNYTKTIYVCVVKFARERQDNVICTYQCDPLFNFCLNYFPIFFLFVLFCFVCDKKKFASIHMQWVCIYRIFGCFQFDPVLYHE